MSRIVNGILTVPSFNPTGNPGEYTITNAIFASQSDTSGQGAFLIEVGFVLYVPASDPNTFDLIPGTVHRYKITSLTASDAQTINCTILWDEDGSELDAPTSGADCIISEVTTNRKLGLPVDSQLYATLPAGAATGAQNLNAQDILDKDSAGGTFKFTQSVPATQWTVVHNKDNMDFTYALYNTSNMEVIPDAIVAISSNAVQVNLLQAMAGRLILVFID